MDVSLGFVLKRVPGSLVSLNHDSKAGDRTVDGVIVEYGRNRLIVGRSY